MAHGIKFDGYNKSYGPPEGVTEEQCKTLHVFVNGACIVSCWQLSPEELQEVNRTGRVFQSIWSAGSLPPSFVGSESATHEVVADFGAVWKLSKQPEQPGYSEQDKQDMLSVLILCGELGGLQPSEKPADYLQRLLDDYTAAQSMANTPR